MGFRISTCLLAIGLFGVGVIAADNVDQVKEKVFQAKKAYDGELQKFRKSVTEFLDKREDAARKSGDKKALDEVKAQRKAFEETGETPSTFPVAQKNQLKSAVTKLDKAYGAAVKELIKLKEDTAAEEIEKEQLKFRANSFLLSGKKTFLVTLKHFDVKTELDWFSNEGKISEHKIKKDGQLAPHSIFMCPPASGTAQVKYTLDGKYVGFKASVGVPTIEDTKEGPYSGLTFEVLGDGKSLWKSEPVRKLDTFQNCEVDISKVKVLTLLVHCEKENFWARTVWFEPILVE